MSFLIVVVIAASFSVTPPVLSPQACCLVHILYEKCILINTDRFSNYVLVFQTLQKKEGVLTLLP